MTPHIFISYNRDDQHRARAIADALETEGIKVWWDTNLRAGESYDEVTEKHLREAGAVVVLWSSKSVNSKWVRAEATVGERYSKLVPAMIEECERPLRFELVQTADLMRWHGDQGDPNWRGFVQAVKSALGHAHEEPTPTPNDKEHLANDITIENTFWTSIKDGKERSDFEAYLKRYPAGHFVDLAKNRLAALERSEQERKAATITVQPVQPVQPPEPAEAAPKAQSPMPEQPRVEIAPAAQNDDATSGKKNAAIYALAGLGLAVIAALGFFGLNMVGTDKQSNDTVATVGEGAAPAQELDNEPSHKEADTISPELEVQDENIAIVDDVANESGDEAEIVSSNEQPSDIADAALTVEENEQETLGPGDVFSDCDDCPQMTILPTGVFQMGSPVGEPGRFPYEGPQHEVTIETFAIGTYEVTFDQWSACVQDGGCQGYAPGDAGFGRGARPALYISWQDAQGYVDWLSRKTGRLYRLPSESEWEYAARGGETSAYWWGAQFDRSKAAIGTTVEAGALGANGFGLYEILGNAGEWVQDCYLNSYAQTPVDGSPATSGDCSRRVVRGGSWRGEPRELRISNRSRITSTVRDRSLGFRVAAELNAD